MKGNHAEEGIGEERMDEAGCQGGSRVGKGVGADGQPLSASLPHPDPAPPADGGSQETCSGGRMNLAPILYKSPRVSQNVTLSEGRGKLGAPFLPTPQPSCNPPLSFKDLSIVGLNGALPLSPTCSFITLPSSGYTRLLLGHSMSAFIDLYHVYCPRQVASSGKGPTSDRAYTSRDTQQNEAGMCVCVSTSSPSSQIHLRPTHSVLSMVSLQLVPSTRNSSNPRLHLSKSFPPFKAWLKGCLL